MYRSISELVEELSIAVILLSSDFIKKTCLLKHLYPTICLLADYYLEKIDQWQICLKIQKNQDYAAGPMKCQNLKCVSKNLFGE